MQCPRCRRINDDGVPACQYCGQPLMAPPGYGQMPYARPKSTPVPMILGIIIACAIFFAFPALLYPIFRRASGPSEKQRQLTCLNHQRQICTAIMMSAEDNADILPASTSVWGDLKRYVTSADIFHCPTAGDSRPNAYGYNSLLGGAAIGKLRQPEQLAIIADSDNPSNLLTGPADLAYRHRDVCIVGYVDGHAALMPSGLTVQLH